MKVLIVAATRHEWIPIQAQLLRQGWTLDKHGILHHKELQVATLITGVGMMAMAAQLATQYGIIRPDLSIHIGIAGSYQKNLALGSVVQVVSEQLGDLGIEEKDGSFVDAFSAGLMDRNLPPFSEGRLHNPISKLGFLPEVRGLTVNKVSGYLPHIAALTDNYDADIETMEGAAFFFVNLLHEVKFLSIKSISNYVEPRDRSAWEIDLAITNLADSIGSLLQGM
ncbi:MAG: futalosine hydrolase [Saprospiraceae bacterium]|nr:futalosine hydrolase [Saprospiraceae bacterium]